METDKEVLSASAEVDDEILERLNSAKTAIDAAIEQYPREIYPGRGAVLLVVGHHMGEVLRAAEVLPQYPADE